MFYFLMIFFYNSYYAGQINDLDIRSGPITSSIASTGPNLTVTN
jgi:hypothetical protein